jgi:hypothetical protein
MMWRLPVVVAVLALLWAAAPVAAQEDTVLIQFDVVARGNATDVVEVGQVAVDPDLVGATCVGTISVTNNSSTHPNNDFIISSGSTSVEIPDFERISGQTTTVQSRLVLTDTITASIRLGSDGVASLAGDTVVVASSCVPETTTTTTTTMPSPPSTNAAEATSTTIETPVGAVEAGGGGTAPGSDDAASWLVVFGSVSMLTGLGLAAGRYRLDGRR